MNNHIDKKKQPIAIGWTYVGIALLLLVLLIVWNRAYLYYIEQSHWEHDIFRPALQNKGGRICYAPLYVRLENTWTWWGVGATIAAIILGLSVFWRQKKWEHSLFFHAFLITIWASILATTEQPIRWASTTYNNFEVFFKGLIYPNISTLLQHYTSAMQHSLGDGSAHYPPGNLVLVYLLSGSDILLGLKLLMVLLLVPMLYYWQKCLQIMAISPDIAQKALLLLPTASSLFIFATLNFSTITVLLAIVQYYCFWKATQQTQPWAWAIAIGGITALYAFFSFTVAVSSLQLMIGAFLGIYWGCFSWQKIVYIGSIASTFFLLIYLSLYLILGFDMWLCFRQAIQNAHQLMGVNGGFDDIWRYILRSSGNILAFFWSIGLLSSAMFLVGMYRIIVQERHISKNWQLMASSLGLTLLISAFGGLFFGETERVWVFFVPFVLLVVAHEWQLFQNRYGFISSFVLYVILLLNALLQELLFIHVLG